MMPLLVFPGGYGGMVHSDGGRTTLSCCIRRDELQRLREARNCGRAADAVFRHILESCTGARQALSDAQLDGSWLSAGPIRPGIRRRAARGVFFAGNSAGEAHPIVAEGISMAMQSAWLLCRHLIDTEACAAAQGSLADIGRAYAREWDASFARRIRAAAAFAHLSMRPRATATALPLLERFPRLLTFGARLSGKTVQVVPAV
jgi:flavin-dependent dehydrogenase